MPCIRRRRFWGRALRHSRRREPRLKIALVPRGSAGDGLLESYAVERKPHVRAVVASAKEFGKIIGELDPEAAAARDLRLRGAASRHGRDHPAKVHSGSRYGLIAQGAKLAGGLFAAPCRSGGWPNLPSR